MKWLLHITEHGDLSCSASAKHLRLLGCKKTQAGKWKSRGEKQKKPSERSDMQLCGNGAVQGINSFLFSAAVLYN